MCPTAGYCRNFTLLKKYNLLPMLLMGFAAAVLLMTYGNSNANVEIVHFANREKIDRRLSSIEFKSATQKTVRITSFISSTITKTTTTEIPWYDPQRLLNDTVNNLGGWKVPKGSIGIHIKNMPPKNTLAPTTTINPKDILAIQDRWKVRHVGCFRRARLASILSQATVKNNFQSDLKDCFRVCAEIDKSWVAYNNAEKRCTCGRAIAERMILMIMKEYIQNCTLGFEDVYKIVKYSPKEPITMDIIERSSAGCFVKRDEMSKTFKNYNGKTVTDCLLSCESEGYPNAAWVGSTNCQCGYFNASFPLRQMSEPVEDSFCDKSTCSPNVPCKYVRIMRTNAEDMRCDVKNFLPPTSGRLVALISFPGSGNTWVRHLIETATGIYTGSAYNDRDLYQEGFIGELLPWNSKRTSVIKTHQFLETDVAKFDEAIFVVRNPYDAIIAEFNRVRGGHTGYAEVNLFKTPEWIYFVAYKIPKWIKSIENYLVMDKLLLIYFEDIVKDPIREVRKMVDFLNYPISNVEERLACLETSLSGSFRRPKRKLTFDPYPKNTKDIVNKFIKVARDMIDKKNLTPLPFYEKE